LQTTRAWDYIIFIAVDVIMYSG